MRGAAGTGRELLVGFSFKTYFGYRATLDWCDRAREIALGNPAVVDGAVRLFVMPSFPCLLRAIDLFRGTPIEVGAQNLHFEDVGPFTGEVSGSMLTEIGCRLVEIGHAERRRLFGETDDIVALKVEAATRNGLCPLICIGEEQPTGSANASHESIRQLDSALARATSDAPIIVAYEPLWAIGADRPAAEAHIAHVCEALRNFVAGARSQAADRVIYGGSAGPGLLEHLGDSVDGLFLGRSVHDVTALADVLEEAGRLSGAGPPPR